LFIWTFGQTGAQGFLKFSFNWVNNAGNRVGDGSWWDWAKNLILSFRDGNGWNWVRNFGLRDGYVWFWVKNLGVAALLLIPMVLDADRRGKMVAVCSLPIFLFAEFIQIQPNAYDNNKLFYIWYVLMMALVAGYAVKLYDRLLGIGGRRLMAAGLVVMAVLSGTLSIGREVVSDYVLFSRDHVQAAEYIEENALHRALVLTGTHHNNAVTSLAGRYVVCGPGNFLGPHGLDYHRNQQDVETMFTDPDQAERLLAAYGVDYAVISDYERGQFDVDEDWFAERFPLMFQNDSVSVYIVSERAKAASRGI